MSEIKLLSCFTVQLDGDCGTIDVLAANGRSELIRVRLSEVIDEENCGLEEAKQGRGETKKMVFKAD